MEAPRRQPWQPTTRRRLLGSAAGLCGLVTAGCLNRSDSGQSGTEPQSDVKGNTSDSPAAGGPLIGMVYAPGGLGDKSFNDMAHRGIQTAGLQYDTSFEYREPVDVQAVSNAQQQFADASDPPYDLICCIGFQQATPLETNATSFPDQSFAVFDTVVDRPNVASYVFDAHEGSFQIGHLAARLTTQQLSAGAGETVPAETVVGYVGGKEIPPVQQFEAGYVAGVAHGDDAVEVKSRYVGSFDDVEGGREAATALYEQGADIVYHAAGGTGIGVFQAAQQHNRFAFGVDSDQSRSSPRYADVILASMTKRLDNAVLRSIQGLTTDRFPGGTATALGLADDGVKLVYGNQLGTAVPTGLKSEVDEIGKRIAAGELTVPSTP